MNTILVPIDFSSYSNNALEFAYHAARRSGAEIELIHVIESMDSQSYNTMGMIDSDNKINLYMNELMKTITARMDQIINDPQYEGVVMRPHVHYGKPYETIAQSIVQHNADLVVMGTLGSTGLDELFIGSNTEKVVRFSNCPVLAIPDEAKYAQMKEIVYATNLEANEIPVLATLKMIQRLVDVHIHLLWVNTPHVLSSHDSMEEKLDEFAKNHGLENYSVHVTKAIFAEAGIMNYADKIDASMIALSTGGRKGLAYLFSGSLAEDIVNHSSRPVLTYNIN